MELPPELLVVVAIQVGFVALLAWLFSDLDRGPSSVSRPSAATGSAGGG
jgi:hypothetical protein